MIEKLKELQLERGVDFKGLDNFVDWADKVEPLLSLSPNHEKEFKKATLSAVTCYRIKSYKDALNNMDEAVGVLNKAITSLELSNQSTISTTSELEYPQKVTWVWLVKHVEVKHWFVLGATLLTIFGAGIKFGSSKFYQYYFKEKSEKPLISEPAVSENADSSGVSERKSKIVFVSSQKVKSDFGGVAVADTLCENLASRAGFNGEFKSWLSDSKVGPASRFKSHNNKYTLPSGKVVAENLEQITNCFDGNCLSFPINENEHGMIVSKPTPNSAENRVWSATDVEGHPLGNSCKNWSEQLPMPISGPNNTVVSLGDPTSTGVNWTSSFSANCPELELAFYCFEQ
ncbi:hypothetical protein LJ739_08640 [Aestuariibacter halophilus]|uniref:DUF1554 domain-containing protein n=1 Tax=Fluctibacter halophilus TaxID=226011 RepID=A0ABS8G915_9ALTE|nr:hypothetical protein [Aestuariibacter halophilus]MCC2616305.1 hypothetical protein [Aestuariibacter halophilus]